MLVASTVLITAIGPCDPEPPDDRLGVHSLDAAGLTVLFEACPREAVDWVKLYVANRVDITKDDETLWRLSRADSPGATSFSVNEPPPGYQVDVKLRKPLPRDRRVYVAVGTSNDEVAEMLLNNQDEALDAGLVMTGTGTMTLEDFKAQAQGAC